MAVLFSAVTITSDSDQAEFLVAGIPKSYADLEGWTAFESFMNEVDTEQDIKVHVAACLYGEGEVFTASCILHHKGGANRRLLLRPLHRCRTQRFHHPVVTERTIRNGDELVCQFSMIGAVWQRRTEPSIRPAHGSCFSVWTIPITPCRPVREERWITSMTAAQST